MPLCRLPNRHRCSGICAPARLSPCVWGLILALLAGAVCAAPTTVAYRLRVGEAPETLDAAPVPVSAETLRALARWDRFAVTSIARAVQGEASLDEAFPLFQTLMRTGPFAGTWATGAPPVDPFTDIRAQRFLDAASRLAAGPPTDLIRLLLQDQAQVAALRQDSLGVARLAADVVYALYMGADADPTGWTRFLPALLMTRGHLADRELVGRCMDFIDRGAMNTDVATLMSRTFLWDLRLYLVDKPDDAALQAALKLTDDALAEDFRATVSAMHLKYFLFGGRDKKTAAQWDAFEAERFIRERPGRQWVGHAGALERELRLGTVLKVTGEQTALLGASGSTMPLTIVVEPGEGASYAILEPAENRDDAVRRLQPPEALQLPSPISGELTTSGLRYRIALSEVGNRRLTVRCRLYGLQLPALSHVVEVVDATRLGQEGQATPRPRSSPVAIELTIPPPGYQPVYSSGLPVQPGMTPIINGARRFVPYADGRHAMETMILYEVRASVEDTFPGDITYCDPNPQGNKRVREQAIDEGERIVRKPLSGQFSLLPNRARVMGRDCWVGRKGRAEDGHVYYVLCRGRQTYFARNEAYLFQHFWDAIIGEQPVYDSAQIRQDTLAVANALLGALRVMGPDGAPPVVGAGLAAPAEAADFLAQMREVLDADADLIRRTDSLASGWRQKRIDNETAANSLGQDIVSAYDALTARVAAFKAPDQALGTVLETIGATLSIGTAATRLVEKGMRNAEEDKVVRGMQLLHSYDEKRQVLRTRAMGLTLEYQQQ